MAMLITFMSDWPDFWTTFSIEGFPVLEGGRLLGRLDPAEVDVGDLAQVDLLQNVLKSSKVELVLDLRVEHPDAETEPNDVNVNFRSGLDSAKVGLHQEGLDARLEQVQKLGRKYLGREAFRPFVVIHKVD